MTTYDRFLGQMAIGDPVLTTAEGMVHVGRVSGDPIWVEDDGPRPATLGPWCGRPPTGGIAFADLPEPLPKRLGMSGDLVDLSDDSEVIEAWIDGIEQPEGPTPVTSAGRAPPSWNR